MQEIASRQVKIVTPFHVVDLVDSTPGRHSVLVLWQQGRIPAEGRKTTCFLAGLVTFDRRIKNVYATRSLNSSSLLSISCCMKWKAMLPSKVPRTAGSRSDRWLKFTPRSHLSRLPVSRRLPKKRQRVATSFRTRSGKSTLMGVNGKCALSLQQTPGIHETLRHSTVIWS